MNEIGGYMGFEEFQGIEYHSSAIALNYGRNCLAYLIEAKKIKKIYLPIFLCESIQMVCEKYHVEYEYYHIDDTFHLLFDKHLEEHEYLYVVNYYGTLADEDIRNYFDKWKNIIVDHTQDFFRFPVKGVDTLYTCRKYFGVCDGAYLYTDAILGRKLEYDYSNDRMQYILGRFEKTASEYYEQYVQKEREICNSDVLKMSKTTQNIMKVIDYAAVKEKRMHNFRYLHSMLGKYNRINLDGVEGTFSYPFYIDNAEIVRKKLIENKIYIPMFWPEVSEKVMDDSIEYKLTNKILPLPCDQRYSEKEMLMVIELILLYLG